MSQTTVSVAPEAAVPGAGRVSPRRPRRPFGLRAILSLLTILSAGDILTLGSEGVRLWGDVHGRLSDLVASNHFEDTASLAILGFEIVVEVVTIVGLWRFRRWAWLLLMLYLGARMGYGLWQYFDGQPNYGAMVINVVTVLYLNQRDVQRVFSGPGWETP